MKITFFLQNLAGGGAQCSVVNLANQYVEQGIHVDMVLAQESGSYLTSLDEKINLVVLGKSKTFLAIWALRRYLITTQPTTIMASITNANIALVMAKWLLPKSLKTRICLNQVNHLTYSATKGEKLSWANKIKLKLIAFAYSFADTVISMSRGVENDMLSYGFIQKQNSCFIYNPVVTPKMSVLAKEEIPSFNKPTFIAVGRLTKQKNFKLLINAFAKVKKQLDAQLVILGEGELRTELEQQINHLGLIHLVSLPGFVKNPFAYMKQANVFVLSSLWEGFGNVVAESLAVGTNVVSTDCPSGPAEILDNGKYGFLVPVNDTNALSSAMLKAYQNPFDSEILKNRGQDFAVETIAEQYKKKLLAS